MMSVTSGEGATLLRTEYSVLRPCLFMQNHGRFVSAVLRSVVERCVFAWGAS